MANKARLPIGIQDFPTIIEEGYIYVDKTKYIHELATMGTVYFLSRPRRFGKSVLISTLENLFKGRKELFKDLWITKNTDYKFEEYPVITFSMSSMESISGADILKGEISFRITEIAKNYGIEIEENLSVNNKVRSLITGLYEKYNKKVVVLVDEYDSPILNNMHNIEEAHSIRNVLRNFYGMFKDLNHYIHFIFLTGVTKFSKTSIFSGLNNLNNISLDGKYGSLLGYTQEELEFYFKDYIEDLSKANKLSQKKTLDKIKLWYNGYNFSEEKVESVYNPFSTLLLFEKNKFRPWWFETGTPTFLINLIKENNYLLPGDDKGGFKVLLSEFNVFEPENLKIMAALYQTGYLTIKSYDEEYEQYQLSWPNREVRQAFFDNLILGLTNNTSQSEYLTNTRRALNENNMDAFFTHLRSFFSNIIYEIQIKEERYYQSLLFAVLSFVGIDVDTEVRTSDGRIDLVIKTNSHIYIIEIKLGGSADSALKQIKEKAYADKYVSSKKQIVLIGVMFDPKKRNIPEKRGWIIEEIS